MIISSLIETNPDLCKEWSEKNAPLTPDQFSYGSAAKVWWKGPCGHEWQARIYNRVRGATCPYCANRLVLKGFNDLATLRPDLAAQWSDKNLPLTPDQVMLNSGQYAIWKCALGHEWRTKIERRTQGHGCPYCTKKKLLPGFNDFATEHPDLAKEWSERNLPLTPDQISSSYVFKVWWKCSVCGNQYYRSVSTRASGEAKCPFCNNYELLVGFNDLTTTHPLLAAEWDYDKNGSLDPTQFTAKSRRFIWWKCRYGHSFAYKIQERTLYGKQCSFCEAEFLCALPQYLAILYAHQSDQPVKIHYLDEEGVAFETYLPDMNSVIELEGFSESKRYEQDQKRRYCAKKKIRYYTLPKSTNELDTADEVIRIFEEAGVSVITDTQEDIASVRELFFTAKDELYRESKKGDQSVWQK